MENIPAKGTVVMLANHSSFLDSILLEAFFPRHIWFMIKNSQYCHPLLFWFLRLARSFPVRRYTTISRVPVPIRIGAPMVIRQIPASAQTEADIDWITRFLRHRIQCLVENP